MEQIKPRKRVANFTAHEKALLTQLIKKIPVIESKLTDGKSVFKKKLAWISVTEEFNSDANVHKRDLITLKRAWDNLKAVARKTRASERGYRIKSQGGPSNSPPPLQQGAITSVKEAAPVMICEVKNSFYSDGTVLSSIEKKESEELIDNFKDNDIDKNCSMVSDIALEESQNLNMESERDFYFGENPEQTERRRPSDYVKKEGALRIKHFEAKKKIEMQILNAKLETQQIKKRAAAMEEEKNKTLLEMARLELTELKKRLDLQYNTG